MKRERIVACDLIRAISAVGIIVHHLYADLAARGVAINPYWGGIFANSNYGWFFVTLFFMLSGAMLYLNYPRVDQKNFRAYYYKRWKSIFPMFYLAWIYFYIGKVLECGTLFYRGKPWSLVWTILGLDGYFSLKFTTYYLIGEWFLGAIVILYLVYPVISWWYGRKRELLLLFLVVAFGVVNHYGISIQTGPFRSITSCLLSFCLGMVLIDCRKWLCKKMVVIPSAAVSVLLLLVKIPGLNQNIGIHILGVAAFIVLYGLGSVMERRKFMTGMVRFISGVSYPVFLLQHMVIGEVATSVAARYASITSWEKYLALVLITSALIIFGAWALLQVNRAILKSRWYLRLEERLRLTRQGKKTII